MCSVTHGCLAFFSLPVYRLFTWWIPAGPTLSPDWKHPLRPSVISPHLNYTLLLAPVSSSVWLQMPTLAFYNSATAPREAATSHAKGFELWVLVAFLKNHFQVKLLHCLSCVCQNWIFTEAQSRQHHMLFWDPVLKYVPGSLFFCSWCDAVNCMYHTSPNINKGLKEVLYMSSLHPFLKHVSAVLHTTYMFALLSFLTHLWVCSVKVSLFHVELCLSQ